MTQRMDKQFVIIFGGSSGMGLATAAGAAASGARVLIIGRDPDRLALARSRLPSDAEAAVVDATNIEDMERLFHDAGPIDHVFSTIGEYFPDQALTADMEGIEAAMSSRYRSAVLIARHAAPRMPSGGSITYVTGIAAWKPMGSVASAASCAAVESMARTLAIGLAPVRVNCISPGFIRTGLNASMTQEALANLVRRVPAGRAGNSDDIARAALFLMNNDYVTGTTLVVDGGLRLI